MKTRKGSILIYKIVSTIWPPLDQTYKTQKGPKDKKFWKASCLYQEENLRELNKIMKRKSAL